MQTTAYVPYALSPRITSGWVRASVNGRPLRPVGAGGIISINDHMVGLFIHNQSNLRRCVADGFHIASNRSERADKGRY